VLGISLAGALFLAPFIRLFAAETGVAARDAIRLYGGMAASTLAVGAVALALSWWLPKTVLVTLVLLVAYFASAWAVCYLQLGEDYRSAVRRVLKSVVGMSTFSRHSRSET
jgi:hypothetical protein